MKSLPRLLIWSSPGLSELLTEIQWPLFKLTARPIVISESLPPMRVGPSGDKMIDDFRSSAGDLGPGAGDVVVALPLGDYLEEIKAAIAPPVDAWPWTLLAIPIGHDSDAYYLVRLIVHTMGHALKLSCRREDCVMSHWGHCPEEPGSLNDLTVCASCRAGLSTGEVRS